MATNINGVAPQTNNQATNKTTTNKNGALGKDAFLQLLVAQMQNQDPLNPSEDKEFISQLSTFSMLEQMQNMNGAMQSTQASSLIGKQVTWQENVNGSQKTFYATVESVRVDGNNVYLVVDSASGKEIKMTDVKLIEDTNSSVASQTSQAAALIGKTVSWFEQDKDGKPIEKSAEVQSVKISAGQVYLVVGQDKDGKDMVISMSHVTGVKPTSK